MCDDAELLQRYAGENSESAFRELVARHLPLVYGAALRQLNGDAHRAQDVAQTVFIDLARKAGSLRRASLTGWLYVSTHYEVAQIVRSEQRRAARERKAYTMTDHFSAGESPADWEALRPVLDEALMGLGERDRDVVLGRFFEGRSFSELAARHRGSADAVRMRTERALEKMRAALAGRGITSSTAALAATLGAQAQVTVPAELANAISGSALAAAASAGGVIGLTGFMSMTKVTMSAALAALALAGYLLKSNLRLREEAAQLEAQNRALVAAHVADGRLLDSAQQAIAAVQSSAPAASNSTPAALRPLQEQATRLATLRKLIAEKPDRQIPELAYLQDRDWIKVAADHPLDTEDDVREALSALRLAAKHAFTDRLQAAFTRYAEASGGDLPGSLLQLLPYLGAPATPAMLERYTLLRSGKLDDSTSGPWIVQEATSVDDEHDTRITVGKHDWQISQVNSFDATARRAINAFERANNGAAPTDPNQLLPYFKSPPDAGRLNKFWQQTHRGP